jgi:predicted anti-sigma-YlaC factor YlaD
MAEQRTMYRGGKSVPLLLLAALLAAGGCSIKTMAINGLARSLAASGDLFASDEDPELVRDAVPFALKTIEGLLAEAPEHPGLLLTACKSFTQYAYAFVETDAKLLEIDDYRASAALKERALRLYLRARGYGLRLLELDHAGIAGRLMTDPAGAAAEIDDVTALYWTGAAWGAAISLGKDRPDVVADLPAAAALIRRALQLDEGFEDGALHAALIPLESLPANMGGSLQRARDHFDRAVELSAGRLASPYVALAENVSVRSQNREEFENLLAAAMAVDPDADPGSRLQNLILQKRARHLLDSSEHLFLSSDSKEGGESQ